MFETFRGFISIYFFTDIFCHLSTIFGKCSRCDFFFWQNWPYLGFSQHSCDMRRFEKCCSVKLPTQVARALKYGENVALNK